ncbi:MAG: cytochrome ubiquinol oxidase subunit I [Candidatus Eisenbacteria bacterium]|uniref:Cytochrome ubiquinol oxidase subunit I n=1 Tax=Eiseniibacteriota bacterium TaxID=2212470 RepID=A0A938BLQ8_UNCEI|nr:cytochrome ubiquinol oxidase subunit I [Candidatus Eisenbacteria bacterium]
MDAVLLARLQFAMTIGFHFIFPPITIGLAWLLVILEGVGWRTGDEVYKRAGEFFGRLLGLTFAVGVATGIVMEFQFGTNWAAYSKFVGDIFGAPLAAEAVFAFFLESGFLGLYLFGRRRLSPGMHWFSILMVAVGATLSAFWILVANSWQQTPAGFRINEQLGRAELTSFAEAVFNPSTWVRFSHTMTAALLTGAFFMAGVAAMLLLRGRGGEVGPRALKLSLVAGLAAAVLVIFPFGHEHARQVAHTQPEKFAAIEGLYVGQEGAPLVLFGLVDPATPELKARIEVPGLLSWLAFGDPHAPVRGIRDFPPDEVPRGAELWLSFVSFHNMVILGLFFVGATAFGLLLWRRGRLLETRWFLRLLVASIPLPVLACQFGWIAAEVGRQPWVVYKLLRTRDAVSPTVSAGEVLFSLILFALLYIALGALWIYLLRRKILAGPAPAGGWLSGRATGEAG